MTNSAQKSKRSPVIFPKNQKALTQLGENIKLARKRRNYTQTLISERTGLSRLTIRKIERGDGTVSIGHYVAVLSVLGLVDDLTKVANDDQLGRKLQDIKLMSKQG
ncbi:helix-turn-helix domain-containing protein [Marinobacter confluentis]|uniref:helix-turn-helix domain-containing protein n=1 Tax=Marinobacter confluentis TaxID=1697557 RepID=UPI001CD97DBA|nr:helix-turn-helix transcriptional regulator [Marinobacter confluentis]